MTEPRRKFYYGTYAERVPLRQLSPPPLNSCYRAPSLVGTEHSMACWTFGAVRQFCCCSSA